MVGMNKGQRKLVPVATAPTPERNYMLLQSLTASVVRFRLAVRSRGVA